MKGFFLSLLFNALMAPVTFAQAVPDQIAMSCIRTPMLFLQGNQYGYPVINVGAVSALELHFDDLDGYIKNYYYTYQLCDADWQPVNLSPFDYLKGFTQNRVSQYRVASLAKTKYVHYQALLPESSCIPIKSGNYLLKVYLNGDTSNLAFTKRLLVVDPVVSVGAQILQPFNQAVYN